MGSRGSRTYLPSPGSAPVERSLTPLPASPSYGTPNAAGPAYNGGSFARRNPFLTGLLGGFAGSWLGHMFFGGGYGGGGIGFGGLLVLLILGYVAWRAIRGSLYRQQANQEVNDVFRRHGVSSDGNDVQPPYTAGSASPQAGPALSLTDNDFKAFTGILVGVQTSWSNGDLNVMRRFVTPEMLSYFSELLADNQSRGVANHVGNVVLTKGEPRESWSEGNVDYVTAYLAWTAVDYTYRLGRQPVDGDYLVEGSPDRPAEAAEIWTFRRVRDGQWLLSAIQQTR